MLVKLCLSDSKRTVPGWGQGRRQEGAQVWGREKVEAARERRRGLPAGDQDGQEMTDSRPGTGQGHRLLAHQGRGSAHPHPHTVPPPPRPVLMPPASEMRSYSG